MIGFSLLDALIVAAAWLAATALIIAVPAIVDWFES